ncbi:uncharacterized protein LOC129613202 [Condylostylus longicornis]|uniref:uncharacterized protein LOC129613202 n=1 Tax=Condylostylus longicornis TaxID=2530218 RepID=UPI00244E05DD|nr:uncharacterized protein LOC129613202 [Condylostylus longicornis]
MRQYNTRVIAFLCFITTLTTVCNALPVTNSKPELDIFNIPISNGKELDVLTLGDESEINERNKRTIGILRDLFPEISKLTGGENSLDLNAINKQLEETIRVARQTNLNENALANSINSEAVNDVPTTKTDQQTSESKAPAIDELTLDSLDDGDDRNKRQGLFGGGGGSGGAGSGNFLFDIIRLFSGSVQSQGTGSSGSTDTDSSSNSDDDDDNDNDDNSSNNAYTEGIPGPVTRLVVLANRGLANLIQDLILRIAATSERLVNFKARLITALI